MVTYAEKLKDPRWQKKRLQIFNRDNWQCKKCGDETTTLHVHHLEYKKDKDPWLYATSKLITLCEDCHKVIEGLKKDDGFKGVNFKEISIYKSDVWDSGDKIIFASIKGVCSMEIYKSSGDLIIGFNISSNEIPDIIEILNKANA